MPTFPQEAEKAEDSTPANRVNLDSGESLSAKDSTHSIMRSAMRFLSGTALSRVSGMIRDVILAFSFGTHEALAALFVAFRLSHVCRRLFGEGALQSAFIPLFEEVRKESNEKAFVFFRDMTALWTTFLTLFTLLSMASLAIARAYIPFSEGTDEIISLMIILMPSLLPICLFGLNSSLLQCEKRYFTVGIAPTFFNLVIAFVALALHSFDPREAMPYVAVSIVVGCLFQWLATFIPALRSTENVLGKVRLFKNVSFFSPDIKRLWGPLTLGLIGVGASQINNAVDALFARAADPEGPAQLWFGLRLQQLPLALFGIALSGALLPPLSRAIQSENKSRYVHFLEFAIRRVIALLLPCTAFLLIVGMSAINAIYGRGDFQAHSVMTTTGCLHGYALALIPMGLIIVLAPAFYAKRNYSVPTKGACISLITNALFNAFFVFVLGWKAVSVAVATSLSSWINALYLYKKLTQDFGPVLSASGQRSCRRIVIAVTIASGITWLFLVCTSGIPILFNHFYESALLLPRTLVPQIISVVVPSAVFMATLIGISLLLKVQDITHILKTKEESLHENESLSENT